MPTNRNQCEHGRARGNTVKGPGQRGLHHHVGSAVIERVIPPPLDIVKPTRNGRSELSTNRALHEHGLAALRGEREIVHENHEHARFGRRRAVGHRVAALRTPAASALRARAATSPAAPRPGTSISALIGCTCPLSLTSKSVAVRFDSRFAVPVEHRHIHGNQCHAALERRRLRADATPAGRTTKRLVHVAHLHAPACT